MIATLTNTSGGVLAELEEHDGGSGATGGNLVLPLPHPFSHVRDLADSGTSVLPMHPADFRYKRVPWVTHEARDELNAMVHRGLITLTFAAQTGLRDKENLAVDTL